MTKFYYLKAKEEADVFLHSSYRLGVSIAQKPTLFSDRQEAFDMYEDLRSRMKMAGKPAILFDLKEIDL